MFHLYIWEKSKKYIYNIKLAFAEPIGFAKKCSYHRLYEKKNEV